MTGGFLKQLSNYVLCLALLVFHVGCVKPIGSNLDIGHIRGTITDTAGKAAENAQVYVYRWLYDEESIGQIIREEIGYSKGSNDYGAYRGPADFKSAKTGMDGGYRIALPPGNYCLVARKRRNQDISEGPITPEDASSLVSEPFTIEAEKTAWVSLKLLDTLRDASFFDRYLIRTFRTGFSGRVISAAGAPVSEVVVTADGEGVNVSKRADFASFTTDSEGNYTLYVFYGGVYNLGIKTRMLGPYLAFNRKEDPENKTIFIKQGQIISGVDLVLGEEIPVSD